jgi:molybdate transport system permease protein
VTRDELFPVGLSFEVAFASLALTTPVGVALAAYQSRARGKLRVLVDALVHLPLVLPPSVVGFLLVVVLGRRGPVGSVLERLFDARVVFSPLGAVIASSVVSLPMLVKTLEPALAQVPRDLEDVARTLGLGRVEVFFRVSLRSASRGLVAALALAFARAAGEFGATLMLAGNIPGKTNTMPIEIFAAYQAGDDPRALVYVAVLSVTSVLVAVVAATASRRAS